MEDLYCCEFTHRIEVLHRDARYIDNPKDPTKKLLTDPEEYILKLYIHDNQWCPLVILKQCSSDQEFLDYLKHEFEKRNLIRSTYYNIQLDGNYES